MSSRADTQLLREHPYVFTVLIGLSLVGVGTILTILIITAVIGIPLMILGFLLMFLGCVAKLLSLFMPRTGRTL